MLDRKDGSCSVQGDTMKSILDPTFRYVPAAQTDIRKTFARVRREMKQAAEARNKVVPINAKKEQGNG